MDSNSQTSIQEAISIITIAAILVGVGCYCAELNNVPVLAPSLFWVALQVYGLFPALRNIPGPQVPMLVASAAIGSAFFMLTMPLAYWLAVAFSRQGIANLERQTRLLRTRRERVRNHQRNSDSFYVQ